jgi:hypothetical protein
MQRKSQESRMTSRRHGTASSDETPSGDVLLTDLSGVESGHRDSEVRDSRVPFKAMDYFNNFMLFHKDRLDRALKKPQITGELTMAGHYVQGGLQLTLWKGSHSLVASE